MNLLVHGWRDINHSYSLVNQQHLFELLKRSDIDLYHSDAPYSDQTWNAKKNASGLNHEKTKLISSISKPSNKKVDYIYSIAYPFNSYTRLDHEVPLATFIVTEFGLMKTDFNNQHVDPKRFLKSQDCIITPSNWSRNKICSYGFDENKVHVVAHGVDPEIFFPVTADNRQMIRRSVGLENEHFCFLNLGAMTWNKGIDHLIRALLY